MIQLQRRMTMFEEHMRADEIHHESCPVCGNEEIFYDTDYEYLICGICGKLLDVQSLETTVREKDEVYG